jgi:Ca2+-binding EF-hand superfamily protein
MFAVMDTDGSGEISSKELQQNLSTLGLDLNEETAFEVVRRSGATEATPKEI